MKKVLIVLSSVILSGIVFDGCKRGENDPFLSFHSRKGRVTGDWKVASGEGSSTDVQVNSGVTSTTVKTWTYDGTVKKTTTVTTITGMNPNPPASTTTSEDKYTSQYKIEKDGKFTITDTDNNGSTTVVSTTEGVWNFTGRVGEKKNKSQLVLAVNKYTSGTSYTYSGTDAPTFIYDIDQLKNKEMILKTTYSDATGSDSYTSESKWTLTQ